MKTFDQLTAEQQNAARKFAYEELHEAIKGGFLEVNSYKLNDLADAAAEGSVYDNDGNPVNLDVPWHFMGGCV